MRRYETVFITDPDQSEEQRVAVLDRVADLISQHEGLLVMFDKWGSRKMAYEIKKKTRGYYVCMDYCGNGTLVDEIERFFRIDDSILKYMTILLEKDIDIEKVREEIAQKEEDAKKEELARAQAAEEQPVQKAEATPESSETAEPKATESETDQTETNKEES